MHRLPSVLIDPPGPTVRTAALILAGGRGTRASGNVPKQYARLGPSTVLGRTLEIFCAHERIDFVQPVTALAHSALYQRAIGQTSGKLLYPAEAGETRQASVLNGLCALVPHAPDVVLIHDGVRPFVDPQLISRVVDALADSPAAIAALPATDTLKRVGPEGRVFGTLDRGGIWRAQTPQGFRFSEILAAHRSAHALGSVDMPDDAAVAEWAGIPVKVVPGSEANRKLTTAEDMTFAEHIRLPDVRMGNGFDVHRLVEGDHIWLCGIKLPHTRGLEGHSDADVALHALTDALLGALGEGDIGQHFPDADPRWRGAPSRVFLVEAANRVRARAGNVRNVDVTIICETPKIAPHRDTMRQRISELLGLELQRVSVKATTTETLGFTGRGEGIAALATATVLLPAWSYGPSIGA